jgi:hypothetical protein
VCLALEAETGARQVRVSTRRPTTDGALFQHEVMDLHCPHAENRVFVMDTLQTQTPSSLSEVFDLAEARRLNETQEIHDTPTHGRFPTQDARITLTRLSPSIERCLEYGLSHQSDEDPAQTRRRHPRSNCGPYCATWMGAHLLVPPPLKCWCAPNAVS